MSRKNLQDDPKKWKDTPCFWIGRINIVKVTSKQCTDNEISIKLHMTLFVKLKQIILKFIGNRKDSELPKTSWELKNRAGSITLSDFRQYYKVTVIKTVRYCHQNDRNRIEHPETNSHISLTKVARIYTREMTVSPLSGAEKAGQLHVTTEIRTHPHHTQK